MEKISEILRSRVEKALESQSLLSLAVSAGVSQPALYRWYHGQQAGLALDAADKLALYFGLTLKVNKNAKS